ncbi:RHS repeat protein [Pedobacter sp. AJM]|uniref:RHS repeat protein n=1 Tax=Pedobacter sp. AJM TaxID=2003629 RepID=UPI000B4AE8E3|nr:RHS repeat domain-containing protein [Pedobacter sp. AJM]OWK69707.1 hypothetical protein CBW18_15290 [Pedobacter sp. AJM]
MKIMKLHLILLFLSTQLFLNEICIAQVDLPKIIPPSPDVASLLRYAEIPVAHSTGVPEINIPIYTVNAGKISLPISLSYHASGIKVRDIASIVGLGWSLNAGGTIARTVLGRRDESEDYVAPYKTTDELQTARSLVNGYSDAIDLINKYQNMNKGNFETQSDRYAYNFNGKSGIFRFDWLNGDVHLIPYAPLKITKEYINNVVSPTNLYYVIIDENGTKYFFQSGEVTSQAGMNPTTAWNLTKILSVDGKDEIRLYYSTGEAIVQVSESVSVIKNPGNNGSQGRRVDPSTSFLRTPITSQYFPQRLDSIATNNALVKFTYQADRQDGREMRLISISVNDRISGSPIKSANFGQSYFGTKEEHTLRLRMDQLQLQGEANTAPENYAFSYNNNVPPGYYFTSGYLYPGGSSFPPYILEDYWGYSGSGSGIPSEFLGFLNSSELSLYGGNRNPSTINMQDCILQQITYPSGGHTVFEFESNRTNNQMFYNYPNQVNANGGIVGGLRIKRIKNYSDATSLAFQKSYTYDAIGSEQTISSIQFSYKQPVTYYRSDMSQGDFYGVDYIGVIVNDVAISSSFYPLSIMGSSPLIYNQVSEYQGTVDDNIGKTIYTYTIPPATTLQSSNLLSSPRFVNEFTLDRGINNPLLQTKTTFKKVNGDFVKINQLENKYSFKRTNEFLTGIRVDKEMQFTDLTGYYSPDSYDTSYFWDYLNSYTWEATKGYEDVPVLDSTITSDFSDISNPIIQKTSFKYENLTHLQVTQKEVYDGKGGKIITLFRYPHNFSDQQPYSDMVNNYHNWSQLIEKSDYRNSTDPANLIEATKTNFIDWGNLIISPGSVETMGRGEDYKTRLSFQGYFSNDKIKGFSIHGGARTSYLYSYNSQYPIAEIKNADYAVIESLLTTTSIELFSNKVNPDKVAIDSFLAPLKANLPNAFITTYTYKPLIGMTSMTDPKGMTTTYEYDDFGRLKWVKDQHGNIVKENTYHYKN